MERTYDKLDFDDPRFPDRPRHPDFRLLAELVNDNDDTGYQGGEEAFLNRVEDLVDVESMLYFARNRAQVAARLFGVGRSTKAVSCMHGIFFDAFILGAQFERIKAARRQTGAVEDTIQGGRT